MSTSKHYDQFATAGSLGAWWDTTTGKDWVQAFGGAGPDPASAVGETHAVHTTDAGISFPDPGGAIFVDAIFRVSSSAIRKVGVTMLGTDEADDTADRLRFYLEPSTTGGNDLVYMNLPGSSTAISIPSVTLGLGVEHRLQVQAIYAGPAAASGSYLYDVRGSLDGAILIDTQVAMPVSGTTYFGLMAERQPGTVPDPAGTIAYFDFFETRVNEDLSHEPVFALSTPTSRTPITPGVEDTGSAATFPFAISVSQIRNSRRTLQFLAESGYHIASPAGTAHRRSFDCSWTGTTADRDTLEAFFVARGGGEEVFTVTIRPHGIGSVDVFFAKDELAFTHLARNTWRVEFTLVEVI